MDDLQIKLASMEGQLAVVAPSLQRIEEQLQRLVMLDKTVAELAVRQSHSVDAISHIRERIDENRTQQVSAHTALTARVEETARSSARFENRISGALYVVMSLLAVAATCGGWLLNRVDEMSKTNAVQENRLASLERDMTKLHEQRKMSLLFVPTRPLSYVPTKPPM